LILVADNIQIINKTISEAVEDLNPLPIQNLAIKCEKAGAQAIDINSGPLSRNPEKKMGFLVESIQEVSDLPILIDTANPKAIKAGLDANKKTAIINGFSLEPAKLKAILPLAKEYNVDIIGYLLYESGHVPPTALERLNVAVELFQAFCDAGIDKKHLVIDPIVPPISWDNGSFQAREVVTVIQTLPELLGFEVKTIAGLSNLTTGNAGREKKLLLERAYLPMLASAGLDMALMNVLHRETVGIAEACNALTDARIFSWETITAV